MPSYRIRLLANGEVEIAVNSRRARGRVVAEKTVEIPAVESSRPAATKRQTKAALVRDQIRQVKPIMGEQGRNIVVAWARTKLLMNKNMANAYVRNNWNCC
jgi:hypothetical protein